MGDPEDTLAGARRTLDGTVTGQVDEKFKRAQTLQVDKLNLGPLNPQAAKIYSLWRRKFTIYTEALEANKEDKFNILINRLDYNHYEYIDNVRQN